MRDGLDRFTRNRQTPDKKTAKSIPDGEDTTKKGERIMRKNKFMRAASGLLVAVLLTTCVISGTFAKYVTTTNSTAKARVAVWGFGKDAITELNLFDSAYDNTVNANDEDKLIAPGTEKEAPFSIINASAKAPEVNYKLTVSVDGSQIADTIKKNPNIVWKLDDGNYGTWDNLMTSILRLSGDTDVTYDASTTKSAEKTYKANSIPDAFENNKTHKIAWKWIYDEAAKNKETGTQNNDADDTTMGNTAVTSDTEVNVKITVTAEQID